MIRKTEAEVTEDWLARREAARAEKAPAMPDVVKAIRAVVEDLLRLADDAAAGRVPLTLFLDDEHPERVNVLAALLISRCEGR
jgi:hypothetical protein